MKSRLLNQVEYDKKVAELSDKVKLKAIELQNVTESVDSAKLHLKELSERKATLVKVLSTLEFQIKDKEEYYSYLLAKEYDLLSDIKRDLARENVTLDETKKLLSKTIEFLEEKQSVVSETKNFLDRNASIRESYVELSEKLSVAQKDLEKVTAEASSINENLSQRNVQLDSYKEYLTGFYGKVSTYVKLAKDTVEFLNKELETKTIPMVFGNIDELIEINFDNFNIKKSDS